MEVAAFRTTKAAASQTMGAAVSRIMADVVSPTMAGVASRTAHKAALVAGDFSPSMLQAISWLGDLSTRVEAKGQDLGKLVEV